MNRRQTFEENIERASKIPPNTYVEKVSANGASAHCDSPRKDDTMTDDPC